MIKIYGSSDDLIEVEGDIVEEFNAYNIDTVYLATSRGDLFTIRYDGEWIIRMKRTNDPLSYKIIPPDLDKDEYSDTLIIDGRVEWVLVGKDLASK